MSIFRASPSLEFICFKIKVLPWFNFWFIYTSSYISLSVSRKRMCKLRLKFISDVNISSLFHRNAPFSSRTKWTLSHHLFLQKKEGTVTGSPEVTWRMFLVIFKLIPVDRRGWFMPPLSSISKTLHRIQWFSRHLRSLWKEVHRGYKYKDRNSNFPFNWVQRVVQDSQKELDLWKLHYILNDSYEAGGHVPLANTCLK